MRQVYVPIYIRTFASDRRLMFKRTPQTALDEGRSDIKPTAETCWMTQTFWTRASQTWAVLAHAHTHILPWSWYCGGNTQRFVAVVLTPLKAWQRLSITFLANKRGFAFV